MLNIHQKIKNQLDNFHKTGNVPNLLFYGPIGSGKTTLIHDFIRKIYNEDVDRIKKYTLYIDCTYSKGIKFIREDLKFFAQSSFIDKNAFKIIILQNADKLTIDAQSALRRCIEIYIKTTRFFIDITDKEGLIKPILSRFCTIYIPLPCLSLSQKLVQEQTKPINLYKHKMDICDVNRVLPAITLAKYDNIRKRVQKILKVDNPNVFEMSTVLYKSGISCLDIIHLIENGNLTQNNLEMQYNILFTFHNVQKEIRNEKLLMATLLQCIITKKNIVEPFEVI